MFRSALVQTSKAVLLLLMTGAGVMDAQGTKNGAGPVDPGVHTQSAVDPGVNPKSPLKVQPNLLAIASSSLPNGVVGKAYSFSAQATGGTGSRAWSTKGGKLPA